MLSRYWVGFFPLNGHFSDEEVKKQCDAIRERFLSDGEYGEREVIFSYRVKRYCGSFPTTKQSECNGVLWDTTVWRKAETPEEKEKVPPDYYHVHVAFCSSKPIRADYFKRCFGDILELNKMAKAFVTDYMKMSGDFRDCMIGYPHEEIIFEY